jgi:hypothetical protein
VHKKIYCTTKPNQIHQGEMAWLVVGILGAMAVAVSSQKMMSVPSHDGSVTVLIDSQTGTISSISSTGGPNPIEVDVSVNPSISGAR